MYCGDETGGIIVDVGSYNARFGWAGEDTPKSVFSSQVGVTLASGELTAADGIGAGAGASSSIRSSSSSSAAVAAVPGRSGARVIRVGSAARAPRPHMDVKSPFDYGFVEEWDALERIWEYGLNAIHADASQHPLLVAEPAYSTTTQRERMAELLFESFRAPAMYLARSPVLSAFSMGRSSAVVVDIGACGTRVTPVHDGYILNKGMQFSEVGGGFLTEALQFSLLRAGMLPGNEVPARYAYKKVSRKGARGATSFASSSSSSSSSAASSSAAGPSAPGAVGAPSDEVEMGSAAGVTGPAAASAASSAAGSAAGVAASSAADIAAVAAGGPSIGAAVSAEVFVRSLGSFDVFRLPPVAGLTSMYRHTQEVEVIDDMKRALCNVHDTGYVEGGGPAPDEGSYELPDGNVLKLSGLRQTIPELLFSAEATDPFRHLLSLRSTSAWLLYYNAGISMRLPEPAAASSLPIPLPKMIHGALLNSSPEIRRELCHNVLLTGGGANLRNVQERLKWELLAVIPAAFKPRVVGPSPVEREFAPWIGGSVLASLGTFQQMWISKLEYEEEGANVVDRKCS